MDDDRVYSVQASGDPALAYDPRLLPREQPKDGKITVRRIEFTRGDEYPTVISFREQRGRWIAYEQYDPTMHYKDIRQQQ